MVKKLVLMVGVTLLLAGCPLSTKKKGPIVVDAPLICPQGAKLNLSEYELKQLQSKDDVEFHKWAATMAGKYPKLKNGYQLLYECVQRRHPEFK